MTYFQAFLPYPSQSWHSDHHVIGSGKISILFTKISPYIQMV